MAVSADVLDKSLRQVSDFPKKGIQFLDMSPILADASLFQSVVEQMSAPFLNKGITKIIAIESRGFVLGAAMAQFMGIGFVMVRKKGKLPGPTKSISYTLEYGVDQLEIYLNAVEKNESVLIVDDVLATGGTAAATYTLCESVGAKVLGCAFFIEIGFLEGRKKIKGTIHSLLKK
jgi:adenine phosphoribosyltransferase